MGLIARILGWAWRRWADYNSFVAILELLDWKTGLSAIIGGLVMMVFGATNLDWSPQTVVLAALVAAACVAVISVAVRFFLAMPAFSTNGATHTAPSISEWQQGNWEISYPPPPGPDWSLHDLFLHIHPNAFENEHKERVSQEVKDNLSIGRLKSWGREIRDSRRLSLTEIMPHYWKAASFTYFFRDGNTPGQWDARSGDGVDMADIKVNRSQAMQIWPQGAATTAWRPIFEAVAHVAKHTSDNNQIEYFPAARKALRQAALDGAIRRFGC
jgi:hypothetical protein